MCVLFFYLNPLESSPNGYKLILISVRDELFGRPTAFAQFWTKDSNVIGGMDMEPGREGGAWLVFNKNGRFASLLNVLQKDSDVQARKQGRGFLAVDFTKTGSSMSPNDYVQSLYDIRQKFNGFTLVCVDMKKSESAYFCSMSDQKVQHLETGYHGFGNSVLPRQWPKVVVGKKLFQAAVERTKHDENELEKALFEFVNDETNHGVDEFMKKQSDEQQEMLNLRGALKFYLPEYDYGSRTHTVVLVRGDNSALYVEKNLQSGKWVETRNEFQMDL